MNLKHTFILSLFFLFNLSTSKPSLIQTMGRAARNVNGHVILYADKETRSIAAAVGETRRRRTKQEAHNTRHGITPETIKKSLSSFDLPISRKGEQSDIIPSITPTSGRGKRELISQLQKQMEKAVRKLEYEQAMILRDQIQRLKHGE